MKVLKAHSLTGRINLRLAMQAFKAVKRNRGVAGVDKQSIHEFGLNLEQNLEALVREMKAGTFQPMPLRRVHISKGPGTKKTRPLGIPVVRDRVGQEILRRLLEPIFEPQFHQASFGFRPKRGCRDALEWVLAQHERGLRVVLDADIQGFFDNIPHPVIMEHVKAKVADGNILRLIQRFLTAGVMERGVWKPTSIGTPQGGVISPLLANIVLNVLDWALSEAGLQFARYADDFVIVTSTKQQAQEALVLVQHVTSELGLTLSPEKTHITTYGKGYEFLGFFLSSRSRRMREKSVKKFKDKVRECTVRSTNLEARTIEKLNQVIRGTANYFTPAFATTRWQFQKLDSWVRMRLRCMKRKRKNYRDNETIRVRYFTGKLGLLTLEQFCEERDEHGQLRNVAPRHGATSTGAAR